MYALFEELEFKKEMAQTAELLNLPHQPTDKAVSIDIHDNTLSSQTPILPIKDISYHTITTQQDFTKLLDKLNHTPYFAIDTETTDINWQHAKLVGISVSTADYEGYYIPVGHTADFDVLLDNQLPIDTVLSAFKPILENPNIGKIGQHLKYDAHIFKKYGINISPWQMDTMLASYVINAAATRHGMDALAKHYLGVQTTTFEDVAGKGAKQLSFDKVAMDAASQYACEDADITFRLFNRFNQHINQDKTAAQLLYHLEMPTAQILTQMEHDGILIDTDFWGNYQMNLIKKIMALQIEAERIADEPFNLASPKQLGEILFDKLGIAGGKNQNRAIRHFRSCIIKIEHPLIDVVLEHRSLSKLKSTYTDTLANAADEQGRVHTSYHQALTSTGRLSSSDPNLQNIPIRTDTGRLIREAFIAPKGRMILAADYSQIELRLMAHFSGDESLIRAFNHNLDIHTATAAEIMGKDISEVTPSERRAAKAVNFGLLYGMSAFGLAKQIEVDRAAAQDYIKRYFARYPAILEYMERTKTMAKQLGYVQTILGRKLYSPDIQSSNRMIKDAAERAAINAPLQGSAAEIIKLAMIGGG